MKKLFSVEQIVAVLKQAELSLSVANLIRKMFVPECGDTDNQASRDETVSAGHFSFVDYLRDGSPRLDDCFRPCRNSCERRPLTFFVEACRSTRFMDKIHALPF